MNKSHYKRIEISALITLLFSMMAACSTSNEEPEDIIDGGGIKFAHWSFSRSITNLPNDRGPEDTWVNIAADGDTLEFTMTPKISIPIPLANVSLVQGNDTTILLHKKQPGEPAWTWIDNDYVHVEQEFVEDQQTPTMVKAAFAPNPTKLKREFIIESSLKAGHFVIPTLHFVQSAAKQ